MSKPKYIILVTLSLLFSVAWLLGLYVSLGLSGFSTERRMWLFIPSLLCLIPSWFIDKRRIAIRSNRRYPSASACSFRFSGLRLSTDFRTFSLTSNRDPIAQKYPGREAGIYCLFLVRQLQEVIPFYTGARDAEVAAYCGGGHIAVAEL